MTYYPTLDEDLARAKEILAKGKASVDISMFSRLSDEAREVLERSGGGTIYAADITAAYKLLESFVGEIERLRQAAATLTAQRDAAMAQAKESWEGWSEAKAEIERLRAELQRRNDEKREQFAMLMEIRHLCDEATGIDRSRDAREPGALGAVKALIGRYRELIAEPDR